jgi:hypothetical protein
MSAPLLNPPNLALGKSCLQIDHLLLYLRRSCQESWWQQAMCPAETPGSATHTQLPAVHQLTHPTGVLLVMLPPAEAADIHLLLQHNQRQTKQCERRPGPSSCDAHAGHRPLPMDTGEVIRRESKGGSC